MFSDLDPSLCSTSQRSSNPPVALAEDVALHARQPHLLHRHHSVAQPGGPPTGPASCSPVLLRG